MKTNEINIRDPFVLPYEGRYYMYGTRGATCWGLADGFDVYVSTDLENWSNPIEIFKKPEDFWADRNYWAPEVHIYNGNFYLFASFKSEDKCRGTQILKSDNPTGPFKVFSDGPVTPRNWECLDGTFYVDKNNEPYMVFCHEWLQVHDGEVCTIKLSQNLREAISKPKVLFKASEADWVISVKEERNFVTDGPFMYRCKDGDLLMLWSSSGAKGYVQAVARSNNGDITGKWMQDKKVLFEKDGGHGMIFKTFDDKLLLVLHSPNTTLEERPKFFELMDDSNTLLLK